jgi:hypothetical protein
MILETTVKRYTAVCDSCGWKSSPNPREVYAEHDLDIHKCGDHREAHDSTGGFRGILGGYNRRCVCGSHYISDVPDEFRCPKDDR